MTAAEIRVAGIADSYARSHPETWLQVPPEFAARSNWHSAQRRTLGRLAGRGWLAAIGLCTAVKHGGWHYGHFRVCQPGCLYAGQSLHAAVAERTD